MLASNSLRLTEVFWSQLVPYLRQNRYANDEVMWQMFGSKECLNLPTYDVVKDKGLRPLNYQFALLLTPAIAGAVDARRETLLVRKRAKIAAIEHDRKRTLAAKKAIYNAAETQYLKTAKDTRDAEIQMLKLQATQQIENMKALADPNIRELKQKVKNSKAEAVHTKAQSDLQIATEHFDTAVNSIKAISKQQTKQAKERAALIFADLKAKFKTLNGTQSGPPEDSDNTDDDPQDD